jgi:hypothetical protein
MMVWLLIWKICHLCNDITNRQPVPLVERTWHFLYSHLVSLLHFKQCDSRVPVFLNGNSVVVFFHCRR